MSLKDDIRAAQKAVDKLNSYVDGLQACRSKEPTKKYMELNSLADKAIRKLPDSILRTQEGLLLANTLITITEKFKRHVS